MISPLPATSKATWISIAVQQYPELTALILLAIGLALAIIVSRLVRYSLERIANTGDSKEQGIPPSANQRRYRTAQRITFWVVALSALLLAIRVLNIDSLSNWRSALLELSSGALVGIIVLVLGTGLATLAKDLLEGVNDSAEMRLFANLVRLLILVLAIITAFDQVGVDVILLTAAVVAIIAVIAATLGLSFALGSKDYVGSLMASSELQRLSIGDRLRIKEHEGLITQINKLSIELETVTDLTSIPASWLLTTDYTKITETSDE